MDKRVLQGQSFIDKVIEQCGSLESVVEASVLNNRSITDDAIIGDVYQMPPTNNRLIVEFYKHRDCATALTEEMQVEEQPQGIGYWAIGVDFVVS